MSITINHELSDWDKDVIVNLYDPNDKWIGKFDNISQLLDTRIQIAKRKLSGYYLKIIVSGNEEIKCEINPDGSVKGYPKELKGNILKLSFYLRRIQLNEK